jgi:hypothetical protein
MRVLPRGARLHGVSFRGGRWVPVQPPWARLQRGAGPIEKPIGVHRVSWSSDTRPMNAGDGLSNALEEASA